MKRSEFDALICWHPDRLYRSMKDLERLIEIADAAGVAIRSVNGGDLDLSNSSGRMLARILGSVARQESEHKGERQRRANIQRAEAGSWWSSQRCFGYTDGRRALGAGSVDDPAGRRRRPRGYVAAGDRPRLERVGRDFDARRIVEHLPA